MMAQQHLAPIAVPEELKAVPRGVLEEYVGARIHQFSRVFASQLGANAQFEGAWQASLAILGANVVKEDENIIIKFRHRCRFLGCMQSDCLLCKNNPNKRCAEEDNFDECYADNQVLRSKCEADVYVEVISGTTGKTYTASGIEAQVSVVDGESWNESLPGMYGNVRELLKSDEGRCLIASQVPGTRPDAAGRLHLKIQDGYARLPDVAITDKNDTFHLRGESYGTFRLMARVVKRDMYGNLVPVEGVPPAISKKFIVKTQRALNDYRKSEYPHYKDELTKLKFIGSITAQRLRDIQAHLGYDVPFTSIETVEQLKHLMMYADQNRQIENKLLELLNMKGKHKHKWDYLRDILGEKIVYDDMAHRAWYADETQTQGLLYSCKQAQINLEKPVGVFRRVQQPGSSSACLQVYSGPDALSGDTTKAWRAAAEQAWANPRHPGWTVVQDRIELLGNNGSSVIIPGTMAGGASMSGAMSPALSGQDAMEESQVNMSGMPRTSTVSSPHSRSETPSGRRHSMATGSMQPDMPLLPTRVSAGMGATSGMDFQFAAGNTGNISSSGVPVVTGTAFQFTSTPNTPGGGQHQTGRSSNPVLTTGFTVFGSQGEFLQSDVLRTASMPPLQPAVPAFLQPITSMNSQGSGRWRRMSADAAGLGQPFAAQMPLIRPHNSAGFDGEFGEGGMAGELQSMKRPRGQHSGNNQAPFVPEALGGLHQLPANPPDAIHPGLRDRFAQALYHSESRGRHLPRGRRSADNLAAPNNQLAHVFDAELLMGMDASVFEVKEEQIMPQDTLLLNLQQPQLLGAQGAAGGMTLGLGGQEALSPAQGLSATTAALNLGAPGSTAQAAAVLQQQMAMGAVTSGSNPQLGGLGLSESDSFNRTINRVLNRSDSDSFKRLLGLPGLAQLSPGAGGSGHPDPTGALMDAYMLANQLPADTRME